MFERIPLEEENMPKIFELVDNSKETKSNDHPTNNMVEQGNVIKDQIKKLKEGEKTKMKKKFLIIMMTMKKK